MDEGTCPVGEIKLKVSNRVDLTQPLSRSNGKGAGNSNTTFT